MQKARGSIRVFDRATAIITGGASGIGKAIAEELSRRGCEVVIADLQEELASEVAESIREFGGKASAMAVNVADFQAVDALVSKTIDRTGRLDFLFNNAAIPIGGELRHHTIDDWDRLLDVNIRGVVNGIQAAYARMIEQGFGHIVNTGSYVGLCPAPFNAAYGATKHAVVGLSKSLRIEAALEGIRVSVVCPGVIRTPLLEGGKYGKIIDEPEGLKRGIEEMRPMLPDIFAPKVLDAVAKNKAIIVVPFWWKLPWYLDRISPALSMYLAGKAYQRLLNPN